MRPHDVACVLRLLQRFYGSYWPALTQAGMAFWGTALRCYTYDLASQAVRQWYAAHVHDQPPTLRQLLDTMEVVQAQRRRQEALILTREHEPLYEPH